MELEELDPDIHRKNIQNKFLKTHNGGLGVLEFQRMEKA